MTTHNRFSCLLAVSLTIVFGLSALTSTALAYPPGQKAHVALSQSRVDPGASITVSGSDFRPTARVVITVTCRANDPKKTYTATYRTKASGGSFSKTIAITPDFPNGRCRVTASTGRQAENSDSATFFVNTPGHRGDAGNAVQLAGLRTGGTTAPSGSGSGWLAVLVGGLAIAFVIGGTALLLCGRRKNAIVRG